MESSSASVISILKEEEDDDDDNDDDEDNNRHRNSLPSCQSRTRYPPKLSASPVSQCSKDLDLVAFSAPSSPSQAASERVRTKACTPSLHSTPEQTSKYIALTIIVERGSETTHHLSLLPPTRWHHGVCCHGDVYRTVYHHSRHDVTEQEHLFYPRSVILWREYREAT